MPPFTCVCLLLPFAFLDRASSGHQYLQMSHSLSYLIQKTYQHFAVFRCDKKQDSPDDECVKIH
jgi:hypothetical protein